MATTGDKSMRVDLYAAVHKALRSTLFDLSVELSRCDFADPAQTRIVKNAYQRVVGFLREHHQHEDNICEPLIAKRAAKTVAENHIQHEAADAKLAELDGLVAALETANGEARLESGRRLVAAYNDFLASYLAHMLYEENAMQAAFWEHCTDDEIRGLHGKIQGTIPPARFGEWLEIMLPAMNLDERAEMLGGIKMGAPEPAFRAACDVAARVLGQGAFAAVRARGRLDDTLR
jgi:hypothetical protein